MFIRQCKWDGTATLIVKSSISSRIKSGIQYGRMGWKAVSGLLHKKCRNAFHYDSRLIKPDVIGQAAACNPEEQEEVADGMALKLNTFVYLAHRK